MPLTTTQIQNAYVAFFNRPADVAGLQYWSTYAGSSADLLNTFAQSNEYKALYANMNSTQIVNAVYTNLFGRAPEVSGLNYWVGKLDNGQLSVGKIADAINQGAQGSDLTIITNKTNAALAFTNALDTTAKILAYAGVNANGLTAVKTWLNTLNDSTKTVASVTGTDMTTLLSTVQSNTGANGSTFTLTSGVDSVTGTSNADTITADNTAAAKQLAVADTVDGGAGVDTLKIYQAAADKIASVTTIMSGVTNVEKIYVNNGALTTAETLDISTNATITDLSIDSAAAMADSAAFTIKSSAAQKLAFTKIAGTAAGATSTITLDGAADVTLNNVGTDLTFDLKSTGTALKLTATGSTASSVSLTNTGAKLVTLNLAGDTKAATYATNAATSGQLTTINAADATAGVNVDLSAGASNAKLVYTGSAGKDVVTMTGASFVKTQALDGGAGTADTLKLSDNNTTAFATVATGVNAAKNFEVLSFGATTAVAADMSLVTSLTGFEVSGAVTTTGANGAAGAGGSNGTVAVAFTGASNTNTINITSDIASKGGNGTTNGDANGQAGGNGAKALTVAALVDNGSNAVTITLNGVTLNSSGGVGSDGGATDRSGGNGGAAAVTVDASNFEAVSIVSNANATGTVTSNTFAAAGGAGGAKTGTGTAGTAGASANGLVVADNGTVTITGAADINLGTVNTVNNLNVTINAGAATGKLTVATGNGNDSIVGAVGGNVITLGTGVDTIDLSKSTQKDTITMTGSAGGSGTVAALNDSITGFTLGSDTLTMHGSGNVKAAVSSTTDGGTGLTYSVSAKGIIAITGATASTTFADYVTVAFKALAGATNLTGAFVYGSDTYIVQDNGTANSFDAGSDFIVKLVGVQATSLTAATGAITVA